MPAAGLGKVTRQEGDGTGWLQGEAQQHVPSVVTGWKLEMEGTQMEDGKTGRVGKPGFKTCVLAVTATLPAEMSFGSPR